MNFDRVAGALIIQHPRIHLRESQKRSKGKGKDGFRRGDNSNAGWFEEKAGHAGSEKPGANAYHANFTSVEDYGYCNDMVEPTDAYQAHGDLAGFGSGDGEEAPDRDEEEKNDPFSPYATFDDVSVFEAAERP